MKVVNRLTGFMVLCCLIAVSMFAGMLIQKHLPITLDKSPWDLGSIIVLVIGPAISALLWLLPGNEVYRERLRFLKEGSYIAWVTLIFSLFFVYVAGVVVLSFVVGSTFLRQVEWGVFSILICSSILILIYALYLRLKESTQ